jgi:replicative DNA helicase
MFYNRELGCIYYIINTLYSKGIIEIDTFLLLTEIENNKSYKQAFDEKSNINNITDYLEDLKMIARSTIEEYEMLANKVITASFKRDSYVKLHTLSNEIIESKEDINVTNFKLQQQVADFSQIYICNKEVLTLGEQVDKIWENIVSKRGSGFFGFPSKFEALNSYATYEKTELNMISAPAKTAKSQILSNEAWSLAINGVPSLYIDREMSTENHMIRLVSYLTGIENRRVKTGELSLKEEQLVKEKLSFIKTLPYTHIYKPVTEMAEMFMNIKSLKLKHGIEFLVYDYVKANDGSDGDKEYQKLGRLTDWLKNDIAGSLDLAVLGACQSDRTGMKVADSSKIERNCSTLSYVMRKTKEEFVNDDKDAGNLKLRVGFSRNGAIMDDDQYLNLMLYGDQCRVEQAKVPFSGDSVPY